MKQKLEKNNSQAGFTLIELLVVLAIMTLIMGAIVIDFNRQRGQRNIILAKNETVTNLRKVQSYMLSSRNISTGLPAKFYIVTLVVGQRSYTMQAVDNDFVYHDAADNNTDDLETISLPSSVKISDITVGTGKSASKPCVQIIFSAPFGKMYTNGVATCDSTIANVLKDPVALAALSQKTTDIFFADDSGAGAGAYVEVVPITGQMTIF